MTLEELKAITEDDQWKRMVSPGPRLELFARRPREGWTEWGNEVEANAGITGRKERSG